MFTGFEPFVFLSSLIVGWICFRAIRRWPGPKLLPWFGIIFALGLGPWAALFAHVTPPEQFEPNIIEENKLRWLHIGFILINCVITFLLLLEAFVLARFRNRKPVQYTSKPRTGIFLVLGIIGFGFVLYNNYRNGNLAAIPAVIKSNNYWDYYGIRMEAIEAGSNILTSYGQILLFNIPLPLLCLFLFDKLMVSKKFLWYWMATALMWLVGAVITLNKEPVLAVFFAHAVIFLYHQSRSKNLFAKLRAAAVPTLILGGITLVTYTILGFKGGLISEIFQRIFLTPIWTSYCHFDVFPEQHPFTYFGHSRTGNLLFTGRTPFQFLTDFNEVPRIVAYYETGLAYNMDTSILGSGWANFGFIGIIESAFMVFGACLFWDCVLARKASPSRYVPLVALIISGFMKLLDCDAFTVLLAVGLIHAPFFYVLLERARPVKQKEQSPASSALEEGSGLADPEAIRLKSRPA